MKGILYGIGVGPGDPELMTVKAIKACQAADVIAVPHKEKEKCFALQIAMGAVPELNDKPTLTVDMPMTKDKDVLYKAHHDGAEAIAKLLDEGKNVAFLTLGDPSVYSTYFYVHEIVEKMGYEVKVIPGITSFCASAAALNIPLCENKDQLHIIPGTYNPAEALDLPGVKVLMKNNIPEVRKAILERGLKAKMVSNCSLPTQVLYQSAEELPEDAGYFSLLIVSDK